MSDTLLGGEAAVAETPAAAGAETPHPAETPAAGAAETEAPAPAPAAEGAETEALAEGEASETKTEGAPEEYAEFTAPEGVELDAEVLGEFKSVAKALGLDQATAQKVVDLGTKMAQQWAAKSAENVQQLQAEWLETTKADKEIGGDKLTATLATAKRAIDQFASPAFRELLNDTKLGNHPEVIRFAAAVGRAISEDTFVKADKSNTPKSAAATLYPNHT